MDKPSSSINKTLISGSTGLIGRALKKEMDARGMTYNTLTTNKSVSEQYANCFYWDPNAEIIDELAFDGVDAIINLSGANIAGGLWTKSRKKTILESRIKSAGLLHKFITSNNIRLKVYMGASAIGYYGRSEAGQVYTESDPAGNGFLAEVCEHWELAHAKMEGNTDRLVIPRISNVLSDKGGFLAPMKMSAKSKIGTYLGSAGSSCSWIHMDDIVTGMLELLENREGVYNMVSGACDWDDFQQQFFKVMHVWGTLRIPSPVLKVMMGEFSSLILSGNLVSGEKLMSVMEPFKYHDLHRALVSVG